MIYASQMKGLTVSAKVYDLIKDSLAFVHTEKTLFSIVEDFLLREGYSKNDYLFDFLSGSRTAEIDGAATEKQIEHGDLLLVDFSLKTDGFWCDTCRTFFCGAPSEAQSQAYHALVKAMKKGAEIIRPGFTGREIHSAVMASLNRDGFDNYMPHHSGHGVGEKPQMCPSLNFGSADIIKTGQTLTLEPGIYFPGKWGMRIENNFLVTENGAVSMFSYPLEIDYFILSINGGKNEPT